MKHKIPFSQSQFVASAFDAAQIPSLRGPNGNVLPEIALIGRSNVGKSSLINHLLRHDKLAKVSSTPGKTQSLNFFIVDQALALVDLPGFGYAKVSDQTKKNWSKTLETYLNERATLKLLLFLFDARRTPTDEDFGLLEWAKQNGVSLCCLFTKADKLNAKEMHAHRTQLLPLFLEKNPSVPFLYYSIKDARCRIQLIDHINLTLRQ